MSAIQKSVFFHQPMRGYYTMREHRVACGACA